MTSPQEERAGWSIAEAEALLLSLKGVVSARVVARPGGEVEEIHLLTTDVVKPKQTVRNVESALLAHLGLEIDHRTVSVAQTQSPPAELPTPEPLVQLVPEPGAAESRLLFQGHKVVTERSHRVRHAVEIEWAGQRHTGDASAADLPRPKLEAVATATLRAVETALAADPLDDDEGAEDSLSVTLALDGVKVVDAFDRKFVLVAVHAISGRDVTALAGATVVEESTDRAAILATLQATDRWVRGRV